MSTPASQMPLRDVFDGQRMAPGSKSSPTLHFSVRHRWARVRIVTFCAEFSIRFKLGRLMRSLLAIST